MNKNKYVVKNKSPQVSSVLGVNPDVFKNQRKEQWDSITRVSVKKR